MLGPACRVAQADHDFHVLTKRGEEFHQALDGELIEAVVFQRGNLGLRDLQQLGDFALFQPAGFQQLVDSQGQAGFRLALGRVRQAQIGEDVARAARDVGVGSVQCVPLRSRGLTTAVRIRWPGCGGFFIGRTSPPSGSRPIRKGLPVRAFRPQPAA